MTGMNKFYDLIAALKAAPATSKNINKVEITSEFLGFVDIKWLAEEIKNTKHKILTLNISSIILKDGEFEILADLVANSNSIKTISFLDLKLTSKEAIILANALKNNKIVQNVVLSNNKIGDNGLKAFAEIAEKSPIQRLNFSENNISDIGLKFWLEAQKNNNDLIEFNFDNNKIHNDGMQALAKCLLYIENIEKYTVGIDKVNGLGMTRETSKLLKEALETKKKLEKKDIKANYKTSNKLLPDVLDIWTEDPLIKPELILKTLESTQEPATTTSPQPLRQVSEESPKSVPPLKVIETQSVAKPEAILKIPESTQEPATTSPQPLRQVSEESPKSVPPLKVIETQSVAKPEAILKIPESTQEPAATSPQPLRQISIVQEDKKTGDTMRMKSEEDKPIPETILENRIDSKKTLELLNQYSEKFDLLLAKATKAVVVLGEPSNDKNILTNLLAHKVLKIEKDGGKLVIAAPSSKFSFAESISTQNSILPNNPVINIIKGVNGIACDSNHLQANLSKSDATISALYLQKILRTDVKFIFTIKDSEGKFTAVKGCEYEKEFLSQVRKLATLLEKIELTKDNFSLVITNPLSYREKEDIVKSIDLIYNSHVSGLRGGSNEEKSIIRKEMTIMWTLRESICIIPAFSHGELTLGKDLQAILNKSSSPMNNEYAKITAGSIDLKDIAGLQAYIKNELKENIGKLGNKIIERWNEGKNSAFVFKSDLNSGSFGTEVFLDRLIFPDIKPLKSLIEIFKKLADNSFYPKNDDTIKFLTLNSALFNILGDKELVNKLISSVNYLKHLEAINVGGTTPAAEEKLFSSSFIQDSWFKSLTSTFGDIIFNIDQQLVTSFKLNLQRAENSFGKRLEIEIEKFCAPIKNMKTLTQDDLNNISNLKKLQSIFIDKDVANLADIADKLLHALTILSPKDKTLGEIITNSIKNLRDLLTNQDPETVNEIWQGFSNLRTVKDVSENTQNIIYEKLLKTQMPINTSTTFYIQLLKQLQDSNEKVESFNKNEKVYNSKVAKIYCKIGELSANDRKESLYKDAIKYDNSNKEAHKKLGDIDLKNGHYKEAMEHLQYTSFIKEEKKAFKKALKLEKKKEQDEENYDIYNQVALHISQAKYYIKEHEFFKANTSYKAAKALLEGRNSPRGYEELAKVCEELAELPELSIVSSPKVVSQYRNTAADCRRKAEKLNDDFVEENIEPYTNSNFESWADKIIGHPICYESYMP